MKADQLNNRGSLLTYRAKPEDEKETCVGYLFDFTGHGIFDSHLGRIDGLTAEELAAHNQALAQGELQGLDENCQIGQYGTFYFNEAKREVRTWTGELVSSQVHLSASGKGITFLRNGRQYRGRLQKDADCFNFKRIS